MPAVILTACEELVEGAARRGTRRAFGGAAIATIVTRMSVGIEVVVEDALFEVVGGAETTGMGRAEHAEIAIGVVAEGDIRAVGVLDLVAPAERIPGEHKRVRRQSAHGHPVDFDLRETGIRTVRVPQRILTIVELGAPGAAVIPVAQG